MRVLVIGSGARENALVWKFSRSNRITGLFAGPGNAGTMDYAQNIPELDPLNPNQILQICTDKKIDLIFIGGETPLEAGVADKLEEGGFLVIGPNKHRAQLETSKVFSKSFMSRNKIPTALAKEYEFVAEFEKAVEAQKGKMLVVKKSGLAAGKGVLESRDTEEILSFGRSILKNDKLLIEEFLTGYEVSVFVLSDGKHYLVLPPCADFKKSKEGDKGSNTGGMGAICPVPTVSAAQWAQILKEVVEPTMTGLNKENLNYKGIVFIGVMVTSEGPKVLEYNVRLGDPETQVLLPLIQSDFVNLIEAMAKGTLNDFLLEMSDECCLGVVTAAPGYPGDYPKEIPVHQLPLNNDGHYALFHAGTKVKDAQIVTDGGRCFTSVGIGESFSLAQKRAYECAGKIIFDGAWFRKDIGEKFFQ